jgi:25S rRNA (adenine2142-N1)-methyltransferase
MNHERLRSILATTGWKEVRQHDSAKLTYWLLEKTTGDDKVWKKEELRKGAGKNNFCIVLEPVGGANGQVTFEPAVSEVLDEDGEWAGIVEDTAAEEEEEEWRGIGEQEEDEWKGCN